MPTLQVYLGNNQYHDVMMIHEYWGDGSTLSQTISKLLKVGIEHAITEIEISESQETADRVGGSVIDSCTPVVDATDFPASGNGQARRPMEVNK